MKEGIRPDDGPDAERALQSALKAGENCLSLGELEELVLEGADAPAPLAEHVASCAYCRTEVRLLQEFHAGIPRATETAAVRLITTRLEARSTEIFRTARPVFEARKPWSKWFWGAPWFSPAVLALVGILILVAAALQKRNNPPGLHAPIPDHEVLRSNAIAVIAPTGDIQQVPDEIQWQAASAAVKYEVLLLEVDGTEFWKAETGETSIPIPTAVRARIVPAKTLLCQVLAFDRSGREVAVSDAVRFRILQNAHKP
jgi:hypothetical protein